MVTTALVASLLVSVPSTPAAAGYERLRPQVDASVPGSDLKPGRGAGQPSTGKPFRAAAPVWPKAAVADVTLPSADQTRLDGRSDGRVSTGAVVGDLPVRLESVGGAAAPTEARSVRVEVLDQQAASAAGVEGVLLRVGPAAGRVRLSVDYRGFRHAFGGDWAARLRLVSLPSGQALPSRNDLRSGTVSAEVDASATTMVALAAGPSGSTGDFGATELTPSSTWEAGGNSGNFSWSYPLRLPPALGGPQPKLALAYSSQSVDGQMAASNNQPSWAGEGFEFAPGGYIERRYKPCAEDGGNGASAGTGSGDLCWKTENAILSLDGQSTELIKGSDGLWHGRLEDGSRIERRTGATNGDNDGEHWVVTRTDGVQYWFGRNRLPGWVSGAADSQSTWTVPVYGNQSGEPCNSTGWCQQAWRWNLDHVVDPFGNTMSYWYAKELNKYARNLSGSSLTEYTRGGYLTRIDYGTRSTTAYGTAPMQVLFTAADRCLSNCTSKTASSWPDTPWDQECQAPGLMESWLAGFQGCGDGLGHRV